MKNNNIIYNKWDMNLKHRYLSLRRDRQTKQDIVYPKCLHFISLFIANSFSNIENICVMLFQISIYGVYSSTFFHRHVMIKFKLKQIEEPSLYFNRASKTRTNVFHLA